MLYTDNKVAYCEDYTEYTKYIAEVNWKQGHRKTKKKLVKRKDDD